MSRPLRILALPRYDRLGASSRLRFHQFIPALESSGTDLTVEPLFDDQFVRDLQVGKRAPFAIIRSYLRRIGRLRTAAAFDVLWIEKEALPWLPRLIERLILPVRVPIVLDYDDAVYLNYEGHRSWIVRALLGNKHRKAMRNAQAVVAGNRNLADYARMAGATRVVEIPTCVDVNRYTPRSIYERKGPPVIVWIGQQSTAAFLSPLVPLFEELARQKIANFRAIGIDGAALGRPIQTVVWTEDSEAKEIAACDIGIMPLTDTPFERGKCAYKLIQYMACGLPVVASPVGANCDVVDQGSTGLFANSIIEWRAALTQLASDSNLRTRMGRAGRKKVEHEYAMSAAAVRIESLLRQCARTVAN